jgi:hypothetical protein
MKGLFSNLFHASAMRVTLEQKLTVMTSLTTPLVQSRLLLHLGSVHKSDYALFWKYYRKTQGMAIIN